MFTSLNQSVFPHTGVRTIQKPMVFVQAVFQSPTPHSPRGFAARLSARRQNFISRALTIPPVTQAIVKEKQFTVTSEMLTAVARDQRWPNVTGISAHFQNLLLLCFPI